ncbi:MAG TPA: UvrB/UvrC motif-containing protein, partial [Candidatus Acidoferrales bacterium]|nr:UvrB/UvrC motif-containing protein [Candidatus Acidoferrales bacterium]
VDMQLAAVVEADYITVPLDAPELDSIADEEGMRQAMAQLEAQMREAAAKFEFERAAQIRDRLRALKQKSLSELFSLPAEPVSPDAAPAPPPATPAESAAEPATTVPQRASGRAKRR